ncbi:MAG: GntR family transcriptional regulator [Burkholderiales bacterium]|jgi:DNA-binding GntR family transcriptional regulator|nr:GntR family transcriptional regulator [Burkholderiales bacterium]
MLLEESLLAKRGMRNIVLPYYIAVNRNVDPAATLEVQRLAAPLRQQVLDALRQAIIDGRLAPGARLTERELTEMMRVSRTVIREVLRQLESEGLIAIIPNKGPVVRALTLPEAKDLYQIRGVLEGLAARLFTEHAGDACVRRLAEALEVVVKAYASGDAQQVLETKNRFYDVLFEGAGSETLSAMLSTLHARIWRWRALGLSHPGRSTQRSKESIRNLRAVLTAIRKRDADAAERITREEANHAAAEVMRLLKS